MKATYCVCYMGGYILICEKIVVSMLNEIYYFPKIYLHVSSYISIRQSFKWKVKLYISKRTAQLI